MTEYGTMELQLLLEKVHRDGGYDFRGYKHGTITRRLARRLYATGAKNYQEYMQFLDTYPQEYQKLADDLTIKVSGFFRCQHSLQQLTRLVLPELLVNKKNRNERKISIWSAACAAGEEPYSIAILLAEFLGQRLQDFDFMIHATDISRHSLNKAQSGIYPPQDIEPIPTKIRQHYFRQHDRGYRIRDDIRERVKFSHFDLTSTTQPLFSEMDFIFCCNILIYLQKQLQERVLVMLYDALAVSGYLILGEVEIPTHNLREKLACLDSTAKIYLKM